MDKKIEQSVIKIIEEVVEDVCTNYCIYSIKKNNKANEDGTCGHYDDCPLSRLS